MALIREAEGGEDELEEGGGEDSAGPSGIRGRGSRGRATERRESSGPGPGPGCTERKCRGRMTE